MKFLPILAITAATAVSAHPVAVRATPERRQVDAIKAALMPVMQSLTQLDTAIKGLTTDPATAAPILTASQGASGTLGTAATKINAAKDLGLFEAVGLQQTGSDLATMVQTTVTDLTAKKDVLDQLGVTSVAAMALTQQKDASGGLSTALLSKVPAIAKPIAQQSTDKISKALDQGISALSAPAAAKAPAAAPATPPATEPATPPATEPSASDSAPTGTTASAPSQASGASMASGSAAAEMARRRRSQM